MSGSYVNTDGRAEALNTAAAHDAGLYDPEVHDNQIVAVYNTNSEAEAAQKALVGQGFPAAAIELVDHQAGGVAQGAGGSSEQGFWGAIKSLFVPDEDRGAYHHALSQGHAMLVVTPQPDFDRHALIHALEATHPVDFDARLEEWRQDGYDALRLSHNSGAVGAAAGMASPATDLGASDLAVLALHAAERRAEDALPRSGRREAAAGTSRVRSYVADRSAPPGADPFQDRAVAARATSEEPIMTETPTDRTALPQPAPAVDATPTNPGTMGTGGTTTNATPNAGSSGTNSPRP